MSRARGLLGALVAAAAVSTIAACGGGSEGTVVAKNQNADDNACHAGDAVAAPAAVPVLRACADPTCWQLIVRDSDGTCRTSAPLMRPTQHGDLMTERQGLGDLGCVE